MPVPTPRPPFEVLAIDDQEVVLSGLLTLQQSRPDVIASMRRCLDVDDVDWTRPAPDVVILDLWLKDGTENSTPQFERFREWGVPFILLHTAETGGLVLRKAIRAGIEGLCIKGPRLDDVADALSQLETDGFVLSGPLARAVLDDPESTDRLTEREMDVLLGIAHGMTDAQIASRLFVETSTVNTHSAEIRRKLRTNRAGAVAQAFQRQLLTGRDITPEHP